MYRIYADGKLLHDPHLYQEGCGVLSPKLTVELNKAGSVDFAIPPNNALYEDIKKLKTIITVYENDDELFRGRVLNDEKDFWKQKKTYVEGEFAFLLDSTVRPYTFKGTPAGLLTKYINEHNSRVEAAKQFKMGKVTVTTESEIYYENKNYPTTIAEIEEKLINGIGGYIKTRGSGSDRYIDWLIDSGPVNSQVIEFGTNLLDITEHISAENIFTVIIPLGGTVEGSDGNTTDDKLNIKSVNNGKDYIENSTAISLFGRIEHKEEWSDVKDAAKLKKLGQEVLDANIEMAVTLNLKAIDLHILDVNMERIKLGDWVRVLSLPHKLDKEFQCTKIVYDLVNPDQTEYTFGVNYTTLTEKQVNESKNMKSSVSMVLSTAGAVNASVSKVNKANTEMENIIAQMPTDYLPMGTFEAYKTENDAKITELQNDYNELLEKVTQLEGGNA